MNNSNLNKNKMKMKYLLAATLLLGLTACNNDETDNTGAAKDNKALFTGNIEGTHTRAYDQTWESTDQIGISGKSGDKTYTNVCYNHVEGSGETFTATGDIIYYQDDSEVEFTAYYPWDTRLTGAPTIDADTRKQAEQKKFDFLYAKAKGSKGVPVNFTFTHQMAKLVLIVKAGDDVTYDNVDKAVCSLENLLHQGTFNRTDGIATAAGETGDGWTFANNPDVAGYNTPTVSKDETQGTVAYTLILFPQIFTDSNLTFAAETGGNKFSAEIDFVKVSGNETNELKPGTQYNITVNLNKTGLEVGNSGISEWTEVNHEINAGM